MNRPSPRLHRGILLSLALLLPALAAGCNDDPGGIGSEYLPEVTEFHTYTLRPDEITITSGLAALSNSSAETGLVMLSGATTAGERAHGLFAFVGAPGILDDGTQRNVAAATLTLHSTGYNLGDTTAPKASFDVVAFDGTFASNAKWSDTLVAKLNAGEVLGTADAAPPAKNAPLTITLDPAATQRFLRSYYSKDSAGGFKVLKSLALRARDGSTVTGVYGIVSIDTLQPALNVTFEGDTSVTMKPNVASWIGLADTSGGAGRFVVEGGTSERTHISFNLDSIPANATIHQAEFRFTLRDSHHGTFAEPTAIIATIARDTSFAQKTYLTNPNTGEYVTATRVTDGTSFTPRFRIANFGSVLTLWQLYRRGFTTNATPNRGLIMSLNRYVSSLLAHETVTLDRYEFYGTDAADSTLRPTLTIIYSVQTDAQQ